MPARVHRREQHRGAFAQLLQQVAQNRILSSGRKLAVETLVEIEQLVEATGRNNPAGQSPDRQTSKNTVSSGPCKLIVKE